MMTVEHIKANAYISTEFKKASDAVISAYECEDEVYQRIDRTWLTSQMSAADDERVGQFLMFLALVRAYLRDINPAKAVAAKKLHKVGEMYGGTRIGNLQAATRIANLTNFLQDISDRYSEEVELLKLEQTEQGIREFHDRYMSLYEERLQDRVEFGLNALSDARQETDKYIRVLFSSVNNAIDLGDWARVKDFVETVNVLIDELLRGTGSSDKPEEDETEIPDDVTLTFEKADETVIRLTGLTGESYEIPELTDGYIWVKADGEIEAPTGIFPAEDCTYIEVALGERKAAAFHFLSGEHETFYGLPGTEYEVPEGNWQPEPTGRIPDVDTQYFETLVPEGGSRDSENSEDSDGSEEKPDTPPVGEEKPKYTVNWINKAGETVKTMQVEAGTKLTASDYPKASSGYVWKPSWIGGGLTINSDTTIREELDDDLGV